MYTYSLFILLTELVFASRQIEFCQSLSHHKRLGRPVI